MDVKFEEIELKEANSRVRMGEMYFLKIRYSLDGKSEEIYGHIDLSCKVRLDGNKLILLDGRELRINQIQFESRYRSLVERLFQ